MAEKQAVRKPGDSQALWVLGGLYEVRVAADETAGAATVMEFTIPEGASPPLHTHTQHEIVYVLEGKARYHVDGEVTEVGPGSVINLPVGTVESFEAIGQVRMLVTYIPGGMDKFFNEIGEPAAERRVPDPLTEPPDVDRVAEVGAHYGLQVAGPPPGH